MDNLYQPPSADLLQQANADGSFFVTSTRKLYLVYLFTFGFYSIYWAYKHWDRQRAGMLPKKISPAARSIFHIFFIHSLCRLIQGQLQAKGLGAWKYSAVAWAYITLVFVSNGLSRGESLGNPLLEILVLVATTLVTAWPLATIQQQANLASGDPAGKQNSRLSLANWLCMLPGVLLWLFVVIVMFLPE
ncbi:MFS transporter permease [Pseudomonas sp. PA15(2017)]|uniref:MFS transporter permease n=1 Tax=Pseudomonas sp. PA15(2017) TaxID=1932111 RepID=UPI000966E665|nr:MFS transporter permease [Pseudomonas sp. PA15(2017)]OLU23016.1 MFS transporter permease [Pseudomonas sp. PA15(2017)]